MLHFWKAKGPRTSKMIFWTVRYKNTQKQIHKYTNTQIQYMTKWPKYPTYAIIILEKPRVKGHQKWYFWLQIHKYTNANSQIHKYSLWWSAGNTQHVFYFWKGSKDIKHDILDCTHIHKYKCTNTQIQIHKKTNTQIQHMTKWQKYPTYAIFLNSW